MRWVIVLAMLCAQDRGAVGQKPKEINAQGWFNSAGATLEKLKGKVVVVEFWATWCGPCKKAIPHIIEMRNKLDRSKVEIIGLSDETQAKVDAFVKQMGMNYTVGWGSSSSRDYGVRGIPHAFVIGPDGMVKWEGNPNNAEFESVVTKLAETVTAGGSAEGNKALGESIAESIKTDSLPKELKIAYEKTDPAKKTSREFNVNVSLEYALKTDKEESKSGKVEEKELKELLKAISDTEFATKCAKEPEKTNVTITVTIGGESRTIKFDQGKGFGNFGRVNKLLEDLFAKYSVK